jgi:hypothetical protein
MFYLSYILTKLFIMGGKNFMDLLSWILNGIGSLGTGLLQGLGRLWGFS